MKNDVRKHFFNFSFGWCDSAFLALFMLKPRNEKLTNRCQNVLYHKVAKTVFAVRSDSVKYGKTTVLNFDPNTNTIYHLFVFESLKNFTVNIVHTVCRQERKVQFGNEVLNERKKKQRSEKASQ